MATWNINWGNPNLPQMVAVLREAEADLAALQETNAESERYLRRHLRDRYRHVVFRGDRGRYAAERFGILSNSPIANLRFLPAQHGLFGTWIGEVELGGRTVQIANVHLQPVLFGRQRGILGAWRAFQEMENVHAREIAYVYQNLSADLPTLILGDFNSMSASAAPRFLAENGFIDSFASITEEPDSHPTWRWPGRFADLAGRIDYIFHTRDLRATESRILKSTASDHYLVVSRFEWRATDAPEEME